MIPIWGGLIRLVRRRIVLAIIFGLSLTYCAISLLAHEKIGSSMMLFDDNVDTLNPKDDDADDGSKNFAWPVFSEFYDNYNDSVNAQNQSNMNNTDDADAEVIPDNCRNSVQGKALIVDERGYVCALQNVLENGCCKEQLEKIVHDEKVMIKAERYSCETCSSQGCCAVYEYCVSCCLHPMKKRPKKDYRNTSGVRRDNHKARNIEDVIKNRLHNLDRFQLCLAICRTSSASVRHETTYKNPNSKHCYIPPNLVQRSDHHSVNNNAVTSSSSVLLFIHFYSSTCNYSIHPNISYTSFYPLLLSLSVYLFIFLFITMTNGFLELKVP